MLDFGFSELALCFVIALIVFGPEKLPKVARNIGIWVGRFRRISQNLRDELEREIGAEELRQRLKKELEAAGLTDPQQQLDKLQQELNAPVILPQPTAAESIRQEAELEAEHAQLAVTPHTPSTHEPASQQHFSHEQSLKSAHTENPTAAETVTPPEPTAASVLPSSPLHQHEPSPNQ